MPAARGWLPVVPPESVAQVTQTIVASDQAPEHLGSYAVEPLLLRAGRLMGSALALAGVNYVAALMRVLPERDPHEAIYEAAGLID